MPALPKSVCQAQPTLLGDGLPDQEQAEGAGGDMSVGLPDQEGAGGI